MEKEWMKLIDDVENYRSYNADPNFNFVDFIREKSTIEDKRAIVQEVERRIKKVVNREDEQSRLRSSETSVIRSGICWTICLGFVR